MNNRTVTHQGNDHRIETRDIVKSHTENLLQKLIACIESEQAKPGESGNTLLEIKLGGKRYRLLCDEITHDVHLSPREEEVARHLVEGLLVKEVACKLDIKKSTVTTYVKRIYNKLNVTNRAEMVVTVLKRGLVSIK